MKNCKTFCNAQTANCLIETVQPPPKHILNQIKSYYVFGKKFSSEDIHKYPDICFQKALRIEFMSVKKWCSANVFSDTKQKHVFGKFVKSERLFAGFQTFS